IFYNLALCYEQLKQYEQAEVWLRKWVAAAKEQYGPESVEYADLWALAGLGSNLVKQRKYAQAEPILGESLAILPKHHPETWDTFRTQSLYGAALLGQQKYSAPEPHLVQACQGLTKLDERQGRTSHSPSSRQHLAEALERLVQLYEATNRPDEAAKWRKELEIHQAKVPGPPKQ